MNQNQNKNQRQKEDQKKKGNFTFTFPFPLNIQLFASNDVAIGENTSVDSNSKNESTNVRESYSKEEYDNLRKELANMKNLKDKYAKENADYKKKEQDSLTEEERKSQELQELLKRNEQLELSLMKTDLSKEFLKIGLNEEATNKILEKFDKNNPIDLVKSLTEEIAILISNARLDEQKKFNRSTPVPPVGDYSNGKEKNEKENEVNPYVKSAIEIKRNSSNSNAREYYLGKK